MGIETKTPGMLIDELFTTNNKCWFAQEKIMDSSLSIEEVAKAARDAQQLNIKRNQLIRAIDNALMGSKDTSPTEKTYAKG